MESKEIKSRPFFHPASGLAILAIDWLFFGLEWEFGPVSLVFAGLAAFATCYIVVKRIQERWHGDDPKRARFKALIGATAAGIPLPIGGTVLGVFILTMSGLRK